MQRPPGASTLTETDRRVLAVWAADCAERVLWLFESQAAGDTRPRDAIDGLRAFARGELRIGVVRALSCRAHAAAREAQDPAVGLGQRRRTRRALHGSGFSQPGPSVVTSGRASGAQVLAGRRSAHTLSMTGAERALRPAGG